MISLIGYWEHHSDWNFDDISSPFFRIYLVMKGEAKVIMDHRWYRLTPNHLYIIPPFASLISQTSDAGIVATKKYIREHIEESIKISTLADICCLSEDHFIRTFKKEIGSTPLAYIQQKKIERAQTMLIFDNYSVKDVAYSLSYTNQSYFIRLFKKITGLTPDEYKRQNYPSSNEALGSTPYFLR
jgi:AraC-like DNA-binding protein